MAAMDAAFARIQQIHQLLSFHDSGSDLSLLNGAGGRDVELHPLSVRTIRLAKLMTGMSGHAFNCTVGGVMIRDGLLPAHSSTAFRPGGRDSDIAIDGRMVRLENGIAVTLDGIAKGFAVDLAVAALKRHGIQSGWVNAGGDMRIFGKQTLPVHVRGADENLVPLGQLGNVAVASSRTTASPAEGFNGQIVGSDASIVSSTPGVLTVIARHAWVADALTKVAANVPEQECASRIESLGGKLIFPFS